MSSVGSAEAARRSTQCRRQPVARARWRRRFALSFALRRFERSRVLGLVGFFMAASRLHLICAGECLAPANFDRRLALGQLNSTRDASIANFFGKGA